MRLGTRLSVPVATVPEQRPREHGGPVPRKVAEIIKMIESDGWYLVVVRGSHRQYQHPIKPSATLHPRTERSILNQAGLMGQPRERVRRPRRTR
ncbi:MAG: type II toxin-antitoxin system HicA family toxin [Pseudonocardia sp.]